MPKKREPKSRKRPGWCPPTAWGPNNPPPKSPGRPPKFVPPEPVLEAGVPDQLAAMRAAAHWSFDTFPKLEIVRFYVALKKKNPLGFSREWQTQEKAFSRSGGDDSLPAVDSGAERVTCDVTPKIVETMEAWLARHLAAAS